MTAAFHAAYTHEREAAAVARHELDLECRVWRRYRLGYRQDEAGADALIRRLILRRQEAVKIAAIAQGRLHTIWHDLCCRMPPCERFRANGVLERVQRSEGDAYLFDVDRDGAADLFADLVTKGIVAHPDGYSRERHDARIVIDDILLRWVHLWL
jgi:hypothetical protein